MKLEERIILFSELGKSLQQKIETEEFEDVLVVLTFKMDTEFPAFFYFVYAFFFFFYAGQMKLLKPILKIFNCSYVLIAK